MIIYFDKNWILATFCAIFFTISSSHTVFKSHRKRKPNIFPNLVPEGSPGLPDFSRCNIPKCEKIPNDHKIYQMAIKYTKWLSNTKNVLKFTHNFILQGLKINQNWDFWYENMPSGNPGAHLITAPLIRHLMLQTSIPLSHPPCLESDIFLYCLLR
jgi:hypothetical protein